MKTLRKKYRFEYYISEPIRGGGWRGRRGIKTIHGYCAVSAVRNLYKALANKWADPIKLEIDSCAICNEGGFCGRGGFAPLNPEVLPTLNANLFAEYQLSLRSTAERAA